MSNCDFNRPCDCRDCRTIYETIQCPHCGFGNTVSIERDSKWVTDRKGLGGYAFTIPNKLGSDFDCYKCKLRIENDRYFTQLDEMACQRRLEREVAIANGLQCSTCGVVVGFDYIGLEKAENLYTMGEQRLCKRCYAAHLSENTVDPSDTENRYRFDVSSLSWKLVKVKRACTECGKKRWLNVENQWKSKCTNCYNAAMSR